jgi:hypothetical protein
MTEASAVWARVIDLAEAMTTSEGQFEAMRCGASTAQIFSML